MKMMNPSSFMFVNIEDTCSELCQAYLREIFAVLLLRIINKNKVCDVRHDRKYEKYKHMLIYLNIFN